MSRSLSGGAVVGDLQVVLPVARRPGELPEALERIAAQRGLETLGERRVVAPEAQHAVVERDAVRPAHAARVEVLHDQPVAFLGSADDADRVGEQLVVVVGALHEEVAALEPLERDAARYDGVELRMGRVRGPGADQRVEAVEGGISVGHVGRTIARLRSRTLAMIPFTPELRGRLEARLGAHERREHALEGRRHAAVAVVLVDSHAERHDGDPLLAADIDMSVVPGEEARRLDGRMVGVAGGAAFLLCRRASRLSKHAGQWALPGGRVDEGETALDAALRETDEELGLRLGPESVVGWLDDYPTRSGYVITPVVLWGGSDPELVPAPDEVLAVYRIGLAALRDNEPRFITIPESDRPVLQLPLGNDLIHAPTAAILFQLRQVGLLGHAGERVDHLEQPVFAWR